jgi:hypothetical protein
MHCHMLGCTVTCYDARSRECKKKSMRVRERKIVSGPLKRRECNLILEQSEEYVQYFSWTCRSDEASWRDQAAFNAKIKLIKIGGSVL